MRKEDGGHATSKKEPNLTLEEFAAEVEKVWPKGTSHIADWKPNGDDNVNGRVRLGGAPVDVWTVANDDGIRRIVAAYFTKSGKYRLAPHGYFDAFISEDSGFRVVEPRKQSE